MGNSIFRRGNGKDVKIIVLGLDAAGKTSCLYRMKLGEVVTTIPTIGFNVETVNFKNITMTAWDVGGRDKIRPLLRHYYQNTQGLVYVVDSSDNERFEMALDELQTILGEDELNGVPVLLLANKQDLPGAMSPKHIGSKLMSLKTLRTRMWTVYGFSATTESNYGLFEAFDWLVTSIQNKEKQELANNWVQAFYPTSIFGTGCKKQDEKKPDDKKHCLHRWAESLKKVIK